MSASTLPNLVTILATSPTLKATVLLVLARISG